jgi:peptidyl-prolyl cis-trans isomerase C
VRYVQWIGIVILALALVACQSTEQSQPADETTSKVEQTTETTGTDEQTTETTGTDEETTESASTTSSDNPMVFRVGATEVTEDEFRQYVDNQLGDTIEQMIAQGMSKEDITQEAEEFDIKQVMLDQMIQEELLLLLAREEGIGVDPEAVEEELARQQEFEAAMGDGETGDQTDQESEAERKKIARQLLVMEMIANHTVRDTFNARHILLSVSTPMTATEEEQEEAFEEARSEAEDILEQLEDGADFAELAEEHSEDPGSASEGGDLGWVSTGVFVPEFEEAAMSADLNEPVLVKSQFGYHIIEVLDRKLDEPFEDLEELRSSGNAGQYIDESFIPWYEEQEQEAIEEGVLEINEDYDVNDIDLPFPEDMPEVEPEDDEATEEPEEEATEEPEDDEATEEPEDEEATEEPEEEATEEPEEEATEEPEDDEATEEPEDDEATEEPEDDEATEEPEEEATEEPEDDEATEEPEDDEATEEPEDDEATEEPEDEEATEEPEDEEATEEPEDDDDDE